MKLLTAEEVSTLPLSGIDARMNQINAFLVPYEREMELLEERRRVLLTEKIGNIVGRLSVEEKNFLLRRLKQDATS